MNELERRTLLGAAGLGAIAAMSKAGPLNPPAGPVAGTGRTLDEVYNRIPAPGSTPVGAYNNRIAIPGGTAPVVISQSGSYVLAGDLQVSGGLTCLRIQAHHVTLDLNGFQISRGDSSTGPVGIEVDSALGVTIRNGMIAGCGTGIRCTAVTGDVLIEDVVVRNCVFTGISSEGRCTTVRRCVVNDLGPGAPIGVAIVGECSIIDQCVISRFLNGSSDCRGIWVTANGCVVTRCVVVNTSSVSGSGLYLSGQIAYRDNTVINFTTPYTTINGAGSGGGNV
jgi:hypothetical protein